MPKKSDSRGGGRGRGWAALGGSSRGAGRAESGDNGGGGMGGYRKMFRGDGRKGGGNISRNGCLPNLPKLFALILPFVAVVAFMFLRS